YPVPASSAAPAGFVAVIGLVATLTLLLAAVAGLGVLNTVVLQTRERVHDLGVFKAVGMTPRQVTAMVVCSVAGIGLAAGLVAIPAGVTLQRYVLPVMAHAAQTGVPASVLDAYAPGELALLALSGLVIAVAGALAPAGWAARTRTASALRAEEPFVRVVTPADMYLDERAQSRPSRCCTSRAQYTRIAADARFLGSGARCGFMISWTSGRGSARKRRSSSAAGVCWPSPRRPA